MKGMKGSGKCSGRYAAAARVDAAAFLSLRGRVRGWTVTARVNVAACFGSTSENAPKSAEELQRGRSNGLYGPWALSLLACG